MILESLAAAFEGCTWNCVPGEPQAGCSKPRARGQEQLASETGPLSGFQAGIPQERVNENKTTMKRMITGMPNAT